MLKANPRPHPRAGGILQEETAMRGKTLHILWATLLFVVLFTAISARAAEQTGISADEAKELLETAVFVDARTGADWSGSQLIIPGARRGQPGQEATWAADIPKDSEIIVYCA